MLKCFSNALKKHWNNTRTIYLNNHNFAELGHVFAYWVNWFSYVLHDLKHEEAILWRYALKELRSNLTTVLCYKCISRNLAKIYKTTIFMNVFWCMWSKSEWSTPSVVFFNPLMLVFTKGHTYLNKPGSLSWRFV